MREDLDGADAWEDELEGTGSRDSIEDLFDLLDEDYAETDTDEADQPQFDIVYQLRRVLDPAGTRSSQEANIRDGRGDWPYGGSRVVEGPRVDLTYRPRRKPRRNGLAPPTEVPRMNLEVDLDTGSQEQHRVNHLAAMQRAYTNWVRANGPPPSPLANVASIFVRATHPGPQSRGRAIRLGTITSVEQVQYRVEPTGRVGTGERIGTGERVGTGGRVFGVTTCTLRPPGGQPLREIARHEIFTQLIDCRSPRPGTSAAFDAFWDAFADDAFAY